MKKLSRTIVFFGSGPVAAESLSFLAQHFTIEAVVTKPRPRHHRGAVPVLDLTEELSISQHTVTDKSDLDVLFSSTLFRSRLGVIVDFGIIVSQKVIDYFPCGIINSHFSLLPEWRGADPITFAILSGQKRTGVSIMLLVPALDEGPLLAQTPYDLPAKITTPRLSRELTQISNESLRTVIPLWLDNQIEASPQEVGTIEGSNKPSYSRRLTKEDGVIDWHKPALQLEREIRAYLEWPKSRAVIAGKEVIVTAAHILKRTFGSNKQPGQAFRTSEGLLEVCTGSGALIIERLKPAGKPEMSAQAFLAGYGQSLSSS